MKLASVIGALYLGIYLVLPGCLCQLLGAFGISVHSSSLPVATCVLTADAGTMVCHCDYSVSKTAEVSPSTSWEHLLSPAVSDLPDDVLNLQPPAAAIGRRQSRAPPGKNDFRSFRTFSGVFLI